MKNIYVLMLCLGVLLLTDCQKDDEATGDETVSFKKVGDPRNPADFMNREEIKVIEDAFRSILARKKDDPDSQIKDYLCGGNVMGWENGTFIIQEIGLPIASMDGDSLYIGVLLTYNPNDQTFSTNVNRRIGKGATYGMGYFSEDNTGIYLWDGAVNDRLILFVDNCSFIMELKNTPGHNEAKVSFPVRMVWDESVGYNNSCELLLDAKDIRVEYLD